MVDSGASSTVIGEDKVRAVAATSPVAERHFKMADGGLIPHNGAKKFKAVSEEGCDRWLHAQVTSVEEPLLSVSQIVAAGCKVVFDKYNSYIEDTTRGEKIFLEQKGGLYMLKMWVPREQPFGRRD